MRIDIGARLREERIARNLSQGDVERRCGLPRCRLSWLENGRAIPMLETLEKISDALEIPLHRLFEENEAHGGIVVTAADTRRKGSGPRSRKNGLRRLAKLRMHLSRMCDEDQALLVFIAEKMASRLPARIAREYREGTNNRRESAGSRVRGGKL
jgi:transcriptional regulator with XRE-family HTH domain